jgi:hypothetical protein
MSATDVSVVDYGGSVVVGDRASIAPCSRSRTHAMRRRNARVHDIYGDGQKISRA